MTLRLAKRSDLQRVKTMYKEIVNNMNKNNIPIWDEIYPCEFFNDDIEAKRLYLLEEENKDIAAAFALCESNDGEAHVKWESADAKALYIDRLGVNVQYLRKGIGSIILKSAIELSKQKCAMYLRLFAVDINKPAINLYLKNDFNKVEGVYEEVIDDELTLREYGFEIKVEK